MLAARFLMIAIALSFAGVAYAQTQPVFQSGMITRGHPVQWANPGGAMDAGGALNGHLLGLGIVPNPSNPLPPFGINDLNISNPAGYHQLQMSANTFGGGGELTYDAIAGSSNDPLLIQSGNVLVLNSTSRQLTLSNLPQTVAGDVPVCVNYVTGQLYQASPSDQYVLLTDDTNDNYLTDDAEANYLAAFIPAGSCVQQ